LKINSLTPPGQVGPNSGATRSEGKPATGNAATGAGPGAVSHVSPAWQSEQQDMDSAKIEALRLAIAEGRLEFRAERVADRLIESLQELQGTLKP